VQSLGIYGLVGVVLGGIGAWILNWLTMKGHLRWADHQASDLIQTAEEKATALKKTTEDRVEEDNQTSWQRFESDSQSHIKRIRELEDTVEDLELHLKEKANALEQMFNRQDQIFRGREGRFKSREGQVRKIFENRQILHQKLKDKLASAAQVSMDEIKEEIVQKIEIETKEQISKQIQELNQEAQLNLERDAKRLVGVALSRFARPYCPERGIGNVTFPSQEVKERTLGPDRIHLRTLEKACGVDISINEEYQSASILGFDPVRRELGRMVLDRMLHERHLDDKRIESLVQNCKKSLFKKIIQDGNRVARELRVEGLNEEIRHMMGALRYRYSFAQNQHFHCAEVGFLCGLLSAELGVNVKDGRRAGLLHDIGKAMDHSKEGGHAVIGADFINKNGESAHIVHAVRAHHYDEQPETDLAYLVIAADAISGARPGARRSTVDSYTQKIADLQKIGSSFEGVIATYILSAGREVRVVVDSEQVNDQAALDLSKKIARKIEEECSYPGLIKLTVVRETQAIEMAR